MASFISEDDIERQVVQVLRDELHYHEFLNLFNVPEAQANERFGRTDTTGVVRERTLLESLRKINKGVPDPVLLDAIQELTKYRDHLTLFEANRAIWRLLTKGCDVQTRNQRGDAVTVRVRFLDFEQPAANHFSVVQQLTIKGKGTRRPDVLVFVNGIPLVFVELKNSTEATRQAYDKNLTDYRHDIPRLFHYNLVVVLSNALETKVGSHTADWEQFFNWEKITDEGEAVVPVGDVDIHRVLRGLFRKETLLDLLENFVFYYADRAKIVAKNHQYLGVNNALEAMRQRHANGGKLGVFWHTQGSGKSFSMGYFAQKVRRKLAGQFQFILITDRDDLEEQLHKTFVRAGLIEPDTKARAKSLDHVGQLVRAREPFVFSLIQKFKSPGGKGGQFQPLTTRDDVVVLVDEAHRSQYEDLGQNLRRAFPNASYLAFTGTPLLDAVQTTRQWFGEYVSRYDFLASVEDGSTVPLFYHNRVPQVQLQNDSLNDEVAEIVEDENLSPEQAQRLVGEFASITTIITDSDRLDIIAQDIVDHFPTRGYLGKGMVISLDKFTALKMHDKVKSRWETRIKEIQGQIHKLPANSPERRALEHRRNWMRNTEMTAVVSEEPEENVRFDAAGLNLRPHRERMNKTYGPNHDTLEDRFRHEADPFRLVFVCAKWLTGFDAPTVSTLYLDKPMQNHTLMQTIARANRVAVALDEAGAVATNATPTPIAKTSGLIVDYYGVFKRLEKAFAKYAKPRTDSAKIDRPAEVFADLIGYLDAAIQQAAEYLDRLTLPQLDEAVLTSGTTFAQLHQLASLANELARTDERRKEFGVYQTAITAFYEASKPDILAEDALPDTAAHRGSYRRIKEAYEYVRRLLNQTSTSTGGNYDAAYDQAAQVIDDAIVANSYIIADVAQLSLSDIDLDKLQERFHEAPFKHLAIHDMVAFLQDRLQRLLRANITRVDLAERLQELIQQHNAMSADVETFFRDLQAFAAQLREEEKRAAATGLSEDELEIFDLLFQAKLTEAEQTRVKLAAQHLLAKLQSAETHITPMGPDWYKNPSLQLEVRELIKTQLDADLPPDSYPMAIFQDKVHSIYTHILTTAQLGRGYWA